MSDDIKIEFADSDFVEHRLDKICRIVAAVEPEIDMSTAFVSDLSTLYDFCLDPSEEIYVKMRDHFHHDFEYRWFSQPLWMLVDYIDDNVGWPDEKH